MKSARNPIPFSGKVLMARRLLPRWRSIGGILSAFILIIVLALAAPKRAQAQDSCEAICVATYGLIITTSNGTYAYSSCTNYVLVVECTYRRVEDGDIFCCYA